MPEISSATLLVWMVAAAEAQLACHEFIRPAHLLIGICKANEIPLTEDLMRRPVGEAERRQSQAEIEAAQAVLRSVGADPARLRRHMRRQLGWGQAKPGRREMHRSPEARRVFAEAEAICQAQGEDQVQPLHLLVALARSKDSEVAKALANQGTSPEQLEMAVRQLDQLTLRAGVEPEALQVLPAEAGVSATPFLDQFGRDLTRLAAEGKLDPVIGRKEEMRRVAQVLAQKKKGNPMLVGDAGVGKTCVVEGLAQKIVSPTATPHIRGKRIVELTTAALVAGAVYRGQFEERLRNLVAEVRDSPDVILFIDEIHTLIGAGGAGQALDAANILKPALARGEMRCIGATTTGEYRKYIEKDPALERRFEMIWIDEPTREEAIEILQGIRPTFERHHGVRISDEAVRAAVGLTQRYLPDFRLPDKAISAIDQACAQARLLTLTAKPGQKPMAELVIGLPEVARVVAQRARVPVERLTADESERLLHIEEVLRKRVIGQDHALAEVARVIRTAKAGLKHPRRPVGVFLFLGATGTGKTELAKALAEFLFGDEDRLIAFDMSEYMEKHSVSKFIGPPPGYIGYDTEGQLTGQVRTNPYSVILFDEIEKAHPEIFHIFLQILDEGRLTDGKGRRAIFSEAIIIMTSNLGGRVAKRGRPIGVAIEEGAEEAFDREAYARQIEAALTGSLRPEFLNRIRSRIIFYPLSRETVRKIIDKMLKQLRQQLAAQDIGLELEPSAYDLLMERGYSEEYGAREMERAIEALITQPLGEGILEGKFTEGHTVRARAEAGEMALEQTV